MVVSTKAIQTPKYNMTMERTMTMVFIESSSARTLGWFRSDKSACFPALINPGSVDYGSENRFDRKEGQNHDVRVGLRIGKVSSKGVSSIRAPALTVDDTGRGTNRSLGYVVKSVRPTGLLDERFCSARAITLSTQQCHLLSFCSGARTDAIFNHRAVDVSE